MIGILGIDLRENGGKYVLKIRGLIKYVGFGSHFQYDIRKNEM